MCESVCVCVCVKVCVKVFVYVCVCESVCVCVYTVNIIMLLNMIVCTWQDKQGTPVVHWCLVWSGL